MTDPASTMKNGNGLDGLREKIVSEVAVKLRDRPNVDKAIMAEKTRHYRHAVRYERDTKE